MIDYEILFAIWAAISTAFAGIATYLWYRRREVIKFAIHMYIAAKDGGVNETEFQKAADLFGNVLYKQ